VWSRGRRQNMSSPSPCIYLQSVLCFCEEVRSSNRSLRYIVIYSTSAEVCGVRNELVIIVQLM